MKGKQSSELNDRCSKMFGIAQQAHMINIPFENQLNSTHYMLCTRQSLSSVHSTLRRQCANVVCACENIFNRSKNEMFITITTFCIQLNEQLTTPLLDFSVFYFGFFFLLSGFHVFYLHSLLLLALIDFSGVWLIFIFAFSVFFSSFVYMH